MPLQPLASDLTRNGRVVALLNRRAVGQSDSRLRKDNTHIGDARFTDMVEGGMVNPGQLVRTQHGSEDVVLVGFGSYHGRLLLTRLEAIPVLNQRRGHRAVGAVYHPEAEIGNYVPTVLPRRDDAFLYLDTTQALPPLRDVPARSQADVPETCPSGV